MVLYFTGTGNSKYVVQRIAAALGDTLFCMNDRIRAGDTSPVETGRRLVIVTPTYPTPGAFPALCGTGCAARSCGAQSRRGSS